MEKSLNVYLCFYIHSKELSLNVSTLYFFFVRLYHPDTKASGSEAEKARAIERSKLITNAYQIIKSQMKR